MDGCFLSIIWSWVAGRNMFNFSFLFSNRLLFISFCVKLCKNLCPWYSNLVCSLQLGVELAKDLVQVLPDHISQHIQPASEDTEQNILVMSLQLYCSGYIRSLTQTLDSTDCYYLYLWGIPMITLSTPLWLDLSMMVLRAGMRASQPSRPKRFSEDHFLWRNSSNLKPFAGTSVSQDSEHVLPLTSRLWR